MRESEAINRVATLKGSTPAIAIIDGKEYILEPQGNFQDVQDFHDKYGIERPLIPTLPTDELFNFRLKFMQEEIDEFEAAYLDVKTGVIGEAHAMHEMADALVDLVYVAMGTADMMGIPWQAIWDEVQRANMSKIRAQSADQSKRGTALDVIKPIGWKAPDHYPALGLIKPQEG